MNNKRKMKKKKNLTVDKGVKVMVLEQLDLHMKIDESRHLSQKVNSKWTTDLNVKHCI
jgi:hypothetical protein